MSLRDMLASVTTPAVTWLAKEQIILRRERMLTAFFALRTE